MINRILSGSVMLCIGILFSCKSGVPAGDAGGDDAGEVKTPVTVTSIERESMADNILLNATSAFMIKSVIKSNVNGYIQKALATPGQTVSAGQLLFVVKTKEAQAIGSHELDSILQFNGTIPIKATQNGYISQLDHQQGDYVQDGEQLCIIADKSSFAFVLEVPFELSAYVKTGNNCKVLLPDGEQLNGKITSKVPAVDPVSQTQRCIVKIIPPKPLPENLIARISITKSSRPDAEVLPKSALLTDETQTEWWVMKMINDSTAVEVPVKKGIESGDKVEIVSPQFAPSDRILISGNYGLPDTALVSVEKR